MRARSANSTARAAFDVFFFAAGEGGDARLADGLGDGGDGLAKSPSEAMAKPASMMSTPRSSSCMGHGELFLRGHAAAGRLLAVAEGGVEKIQVI
jgi:hypothetical protein